MSNFDQELDARGLNCPLPILRAKKTLNAMTGEDHGDRPQFRQRL